MEVSHNSLKKLRSVLIFKNMILILSSTYDTLVCVHVNKFINEKAFIHKILYIIVPYKIKRPILFDGVLFFSC